MNTKREGSHWRLALNSFNANVNANVNAIAALESALRCFLPRTLRIAIGWRIGWNKLANRLVRKKEREDLQRYLFTWEVALKPSNANVNAISALRHALNGAAIVFAGPFVALNGTLNGSVPFYGPNFVLDGEVGG